MTRPPVIFDDAVVVALDVIRAGLAAASVTATVHNRIPSPRPAAFVVVRRAGGASTELVIDAATLTVDAWAQAEDEASALAESVRTIINSAGGVYGSSQVSYTQEISGPKPMPDSESQQPRFTAVYSIRTRGH